MKKKDIQCTIKTNKLIKHTAAVHISNEITVLDRKVYNILLKNAYGKYKTSAYHYISTQDLLNELGRQNYKNYMFIEEVVKKLVNTSITFNIFQKDKKHKWGGTIAMLADAIPQNGQIKYSFPLSLTQAFSNPNIYTTLNLDYQRQLNSKYSLALWEFCTEQLDSKKVSNIKTNIIELETLRHLLGAKEKLYDQFKFLNTKVIKPSIQEINNNTDIQIVCGLKKDNRKVIGIFFEISRAFVKSQSPNVENEPNILKLINNTFSQQEVWFRGSELKLQDKFIENLLIEYQPLDVEKAFKLVLEKIHLGVKIHNIVGYIKKILATGITENINSSDVLESVQSDKITEREKMINPENKNLILFFKKLKEKFDVNTYRNWLSHLVFASEDSNEIKFYVHNNFIRNWIYDNYHDDILQTWKEINSKISILTIDLSDKKSVAAATD